MDDYFRIVITGFQSSGKSWLANRLFQAFKNNKDFQYKEIDQQEQIFQESDQVQQEPQTTKVNIFTQKCQKIDDLKIEIIETYGIGSFTDIPIHQQIEKILSSQVRVDYFIYVNPCDYQLVGEILRNFTYVSKVCTPERLIVYLSRDFYYIKDDGSHERKPTWQKIIQDWNKKKDLYNQTGLHTDAKVLADLLKDKNTKKLNHRDNILVYSQHFHKFENYLTDKMTYNLVDISKVDDPTIQFDLAILDFELMSKQKQLDTFLNDERFFQKCAVFIDEQEMTNFTLFCKQYKRINYMKGIISQETIYILSQNHLKIDKGYFLKYGFTV